MTTAIEAENLEKTFGGTVRALDGVSFGVDQGTVFGLLGPNGAGKTTAVRVLTTIVRPDGGSARVLGHDVVAQAGRVRSLIGLAGQYAAVDENLTGRENIFMVGRLNHLARDVVHDARGGTPRALRSDRRRRPDAQDLFRRHAPAPGPGRRPGGAPGCALSRRAHHRARSSAAATTSGR